MKRILALILALTLLLVASACGKAETPDSSDAVSASDYPVTVTDQAGRTVTIESTPEKVVSGYYISTSLLIALGQEEKLVGIEAKADKRNIYKLSAPELIELPNVGTAKEFDLEGCAALEPDLVILPLKLKSAAETLENLGIAVILVNPENQALFTESMDIIAKVMDCETDADKLAQFTEKQKAYLSDTLANVADEEKPRVYLGGNSDFLSTAGSSMYQSDLITLAGGVNVAAEITDTYWATVSYEQILTWNPEYIILASDASYTVEDVLNDSNLKGCTAIELGNVYKLPSKAEAWDSPVPSGILGSVWTASKLHSDKISEETCNNIIEEFYETFYGFSYSEA